MKRKLLAKQDFEKTEADYKYNLDRWKFTYEAYRIDSLDRKRQLESNALLEARMSAKLARCKENFG